MKKRTIILLISIVLVFIIGLNFNFNYSASGDYYSDITQYKYSDIDINNAAYIASLAREHIKTHSNLAIDITDNIFDNFIIYVNNDNKSFSISFYFGDILPCAVSTSSKYFKEISGVQRIFFNSSDFEDIKYSKRSSSSTIVVSGTTEIYYNFDMLLEDGSVVGLERNITNYVNIYGPAEPPTFYYDIEECDTGYKVAITPLNINIPYTLKCYLNNSVNNYYLLQENKLVTTTSNFIVDKNTTNLLFVCEHPDGALSLDVELSKLNFGNSGTTSGSGGSNSDSNNMNKPFLTLKSIYNVTNWVTTVTTNNMQTGYKLYYSYDGGFTLNDLGFSYGINEYQVTTMKDEATRIMFLIESPEDGIIHTMEHILLESSYDGSYSGLFGNIDSDIDIENLSVNDGVSAIKQFFNSVFDIFKMFLDFINFLPPWIVVPLSTFLVTVIILAILKIVRG